MRILATDVQYADPRAFAAGVVFENWTDEEPLETYRIALTDAPVASWVPAYIEEEIAKWVAEIPHFGESYLEDLPAFARRTIMERVA